MPPTNTPTASPTTSSRPSMGPSLSTIPSTRPTNLPSYSPTAFPTIQPSSRPSRVPTSFPSVSPSRAPSIHPSASSKPSHTPTDRPSVSPSASIAPSQRPTNLPSYSPSTIPSAIPSASLAPSNLPTPFASDAPSLSLVPTAKTVETDSSDGLVSTCIATPPAGNTRVQALAFRYNLFLEPSANANDAVESMESSLHFGLAGNFLSCTFDGSFQIVAIDSKPTDTIGPDACDTTGAQVPTVPSSCLVVDAVLSMVAVFPNVRRLDTTTEANPQVLDATAEYLDDSMSNGDFVTDEILQVTFLGFVNVQTEPQTTSGGGEGIVAGAIGGEALLPNNKDSSVVGGAVIVGFAACVFIVAAVVSMRYRQSRREEYMRHLDELSVVSDKPLEKTEPIDSDGKVEFVGDEFALEAEDDVDSLEEMFQVLDAEERAHADVHHCSSATCRICQYNEIRPTFVAPDLSIDDLRRHYPSPERKRTRQTPQSPDTVDL